jgi:hypothetical protein
MALDDEKIQEQKSTTLADKMKVILLLAFPAVVENF